MDRYVWRIVLLSLFATTLEAQNIAAYSVAGRAETIERATLLGGGIVLGSTFSRGALHLQLRGEAMRGSRDHVASPCAGLVPIGATFCTPQRLHTTTTLESGSVGVRAPLAHLARMTVSLLGTVGIARINTGTRDSTQKERLSARRLMFVPEAGADVRWQPVVRIPFALNAGVAIGSIRPIVEDRVADGYTPFNDPLGLRRVWLGMAYAFDR